MTPVHDVDLQNSCMPTCQICNLQSDHKFAAISANPLRGFAEPSQRLWRTLSEASANPVRGFAGRQSRQDLASGLIRVIASRQSRQDLACWFQWHLHILEVPLIYVNSLQLYSCIHCILALRECMFAQWRTTRWRALNRPTNASRQATRKQLNARLERAIYQSYTRQQGATFVARWRPYTSIGDDTPTIHGLPDPSRGHLAPPAR